MYSRWYNVAVVLLWLGAMTWLTLAKVLPPLLIGERPSYDTILGARTREPPVAWNLFLGDESLGWALCTTDALPQELTEIRSRVHFHRLPLEQIMPEWLAGMLKPLERSMSDLQMDTESMVVIDPLGRLSQFESAVWFDPMRDAIRMRGTVEENRLQVEIRAGGEKVYGDEVYLPSDALLGDALSPQTQLPGLRTGQKWTVPTYSLLAPHNSPMEILTARVKGMERIVWAGESVDTWLVVYRNEDGSGVGSEDALRARLWVRPDGTVLRQETRLLSAAMTFVRLPDERAEALRKRVEREDKGKYLWRTRPSPAESAGPTDGDATRRKSPDSVGPATSPAPRRRGASAPPVMTDESR